MTTKQFDNYLHKVRVNPNRISLTEVRAAAWRMTEEQLLQAKKVFRELGCVWCTRCDLLLEECSCPKA